MSLHRVQTEILARKEHKDPEENLCVAFATASLTISIYTTSDNLHYGVCSYPRVHRDNVDLLGHLELMVLQAIEENVAILAPRVIRVQRYGSDQMHRL